MLNIRHILHLALILSIVNCGGGGGGSSGEIPPDTSVDTGIGWIGFTLPSPYGSYTTDLATVELGGTTFLNEDAECFGPYNLTGTLGDGYRVSWTNSANATSGTAWSGISCVNILGAGAFGWWKVYYGIVSLELGVNEITATSHEEWRQPFRSD
jgi:hypothetical protein